jgi:hypothetical protein
MLTRIVFIDLLRNRVSDAAGMILTPRSAPVGWTSTHSTRVPRWSPTPWFFPLTPSPLLKARGARRDVLWKPPHPLPTSTFAKT